MPDRPYWDEAQLEQDHVTPAVLAIGDSWFWYPIGQCLLDPIVSGVWQNKYCLYAIGANGAEMRDFVDGKFRNVVRDALKAYGPGLSAVFLSGGGNDFAGWTDLRRLLKPDCTGEAAAASCFDEQRIGKLFSALKRYYAALIMQIQENCRADIKVVVHNYDYALPSGAGLLGDQRWLRTPMADRRVREALMAACVRYLIDQLGVVLDELAAEYPCVRVVRSAGCLAADDWANELHPTPAGFAKLVAQRWAPVLKDILP
jgi:hypothetical protein